MSFRNGSFSAKIQNVSMRKKVSPMHLQRKSPFFITIELDIQLDYVLRLASRTGLHVTSTRTNQLYNCICTLIPKFLAKDFLPYCMCI